MALFSRRHVLGLGVGALSAARFGPAAAENGAEVHGMSVFGDLKYPADFQHFDYVNIAAPKGGVFSFIPSVRAYNQNFQTFNSLNSYILKGDGAQGMDMTFASLMVRASDEPDAMYGLAAKSVQISADKLTYRFTLRPEARFHDGSKLTAHDAAFSLTTLKTKGHPLILQQMRDMVKAEAADDATLVVTFAEKRARDVPLYVAGLPIFSQAYYATRPFDESTLDIPLGCGPYKVGKFEANRYIEFERVKDWWGAELPVSRGFFNFDNVRYEFYRDREVAFEGFTGRNYLFREEFTARVWATRYDFPAVKDGRVKQEVLPDDTPSGAQGWFMNTRRAQIQGSARARGADPGVRFRMDQQDHHVRCLQAHPFAVPEFGHDGERAAVAGRTQAAGAVPRPGAGRSVRLAVRAARVGWVGPGPDLAAQGLATAAGRRLPDQGHQAAAPEWRSLQDRIPDRRAVDPAAPRALHQEPRNARDRGQHTHGRRRAIPRPAGRFRFRHGDVALFHVGDARRRHAPVLLVAGRRHQGLVQHGGHRQSRHRCLDREDHRRRQPRRSHGGVPRLRPGVPRRALLGAAMVPCHPPGRLLGPVRASGKPARITAKASARRKTGGPIRPRPPRPSRRNNS